MAQCPTGYFAGLSDVVCKLGKINGFMLTDKGTTFTDTTFIAEATHHVGIASMTDASRNSMVYPVLNFENTTDDITIQTSNLNLKDKDGSPVPSALVFIDVSACDYQTLQGLEGKYFDIILFTDEGKQLGTRKGIDSIKGFRAKIALKYDLPPSDNGQLQFAVYLFFRAPEEFKKVVYQTPGYSFSDLVDFVPVGLGIEILTAYTSSSGQIQIKVTKRSTGLGQTGYAAADFVVLESNGDAPVSTTIATDEGLGSYLLTVHEDVGSSPTALDVGEYFVMQVSKDDGTYNTHQSAAFREDVLV